MKTKKNVLKFKKTQKMKKNLRNYKSILYEQFIEEHYRNRAKYFLSPRNLKKIGKNPTRNDEIILSLRFTIKI